MTPPWRKDVVRWITKDNILMLSVAFTWLIPKAAAMAAAYPGPVQAGGPAIRIMGVPKWAIGSPSGIACDVLAMHNPDATFTTRGCPRSCPFCAVSKIDGEFRELKTWKRAPIICDNNFLAASKKHIESVVDSLVGIRGVDFNQGLDARLFTPWHADQISRLRVPFVRFSFDHISQDSEVADAVALARKTGIAKDRLSVYVLLGYNDTPEDARHRLDLVRSWGIRPWPMRYQPLDDYGKNTYVAPGWTQNELLRMVRYYAHLRWWEHIPYEDYQGGQKDQMDLFAENPK